jgi:hypothetical protein
MRAAWRDPATGLWRDTLFMRYVVAPRDDPYRPGGAGGTGGTLGGRAAL